MGWKPDEIHDLGNGWREEIKYRRSPSPGGPIPRLRKVFDQDGQLVEIWHEVIGARGAMLHQHQKSIRRKE